MYVSRTYYTVLGAYYAFDNSGSYNAQSLQYYRSLPAATYVSPVSGLQGRGRQLVSITRWGPLSEGTALGSHCSLEWGIAEAACSAPVPELKFGGWAPS